ncbi:hypothetical protein [Nocardia sp. NPDC055049]
MISTSSVTAAIETQAKALGPILFAGMAASLVSSGRRARSLSHPKYPHLLPLILRAELREFLETETLPNGWAVGGDPRAMGQLLLVNPVLGMEMSFLKERRRTYPGGVPTAGRNPARRARWTQGELDLDLGLPSLPSTADPEMKLLLCWDFASRATLDQFVLRIVHTLAPGKYGSAVPCDLILEVQDSGSIFSHLKFAGSDDADEDFFTVDIQKDENGFT